MTLYLAEYSLQQTVLVQSVELYRQRNKMELLIVQTICYDLGYDGDGIVRISQMLADQYMFEHTWVLSCPGYHRCLLTSICLSIPGYCAVQDVTDAC